MLPRDVADSWFSVLQAMGSWAGPRNKASFGYPDNILLPTAADSPTNFNALPRVEFQKIIVGPQYTWYPVTMAGWVQ